MININQYENMTACLLYLDGARNTSYFQPAVCLSGGGFRLQNLRINKCLPCLQGARIASQYLVHLFRG